MGIQSWLSLWFGLTLPAIVLMYMFKRKYVDTTVPSHLLWERVLRNLEANRPWQKLQNRLLLWLQLFAAALMVFALMQPFMQVSGGGSAHVVIVADTSGSMSAQIQPSAEGEAASRLQMMQQRIKEYVKDQGRRSEITLLSVGASPTTLVSHESDRAAIDKAVDGLRPYYGQASYRETLSLASALTREERDAEVVIFTDSFWKQDTAPITFQVPVSVEKVQGEPPLNVSIDQFGISPKGETGSSYGAVAVLSTNAKEAMSAEVNLYGDEQLLASKVLNLTPGKKLTESFADLPFAEVYRLELSENDGYAADNYSFAFGLGHGSSRVLLLTSGNLFLEKALQLSGAEVTRVAWDGSEDKKDGNPVTDQNTDKGSAALDVPPVPDGEFDLLVVDGSMPEGFKQGKWAELTAKTALWTIGGEGTKVGSKGGRAVLAKHPVTAYVTLSGVYFGTLVDQAPAWGEPVVKLGDQPIVYAGSENGRPRLSFNFLLQDSDLPLSPEFPVMVSNALEWMTSGKGSGLGRYMAGAQADIPIAADTVAAKWVPKSGLALADGLPAAEALRNEQGISPVQLVPEYPGLYAFEQQNEAGEKLKFWLAVTADPYEADWSNDQGPVVSQTSPNSDDTAAGERAGTSGHSETASDAGSLMPWLAALALAVIAAEWGVYQRGRSI
ncbi:BatA and WFA domain-containing protein [Paenibacillus sp. ISL-20]|uniref:vWA domain-containing protein n=1 Tax=Paenibacillus sp. ISL-20 TaxID=2819163 RepID=UPI001BEC3BA0|nr:BatA and WFA domain-containing protein [Paenibacillus sp. ISL-20]MBT2762129.1 BatA and WFA domain-containing protein [Paenibacillus sp. ISL-20]